jgi:hypothetical protein
MIPHRSSHADATQQTHPDEPAVLLGVPLMTMPIPLQSGSSRGNTRGNIHLVQHVQDVQKPPDLQALDPGEPTYAE